MDIVTLLGIAALVFGFGMVIFIHEMGHFLAARTANPRQQLVIAVADELEVLPGAYLEGLVSESLPELVAVSGGVALHAMRTWLVPASAGPWTATALQGHGLRLLIAQPV